jgi:hypothetical protein
MYIQGDAFTQALNYLRESTFDSVEFQVMVRQQNSYFAQRRRDGGPGPAYAKPSYPGQIAMRCDEQERLDDAAGRVSQIRT